MPLAGQAVLDGPINQRSMLAVVVPDQAQELQQVAEVQQLTCAKLQASPFLNGIIQATKHAVRLCSRRLRLQQLW